MAQLQPGAASATSDLELARSTGANLLVVAADDIVAELLASLWPSLASPIVVRHRGERLRLQQTSPPVATMVVYDVDTLTGDEQRALHHWITVNRTRVVSTASKCLWPMLQAGAFNDALYYRLNVVLIDPASPVAW
jgi:hypothetical protein